MYDDADLTRDLHLGEAMMDREEIFQLFLEDMEQPALQFALHRSFRKWADLRDQLIKAYTAKTGIPADEFHTQIALKNVGLLG